MKRKRIAVIGAGRSGLAAIKSCREENLDVVCFEKTDSFGGVWKYREDDLDGVGSIMKSTVNIFSKEVDAFSDFPPPEDFPNYMHNAMMMEYLDMYAETFGLLDYIRYRHEVVRLFPAWDHKTSGRWVVKYKCLDEREGGESEEVFDGVMVCTGRRSYPKQPQFPNQELFKGKIMHSKLLKTSAGFEKKNVLIVGFGNSAVDAAVEVSVRANQVYLSTRSGGWVIPKVGEGGFPFDLSLFRRRNYLRERLTGTKFAHRLESKIRHRFDHEMYDIKPDHDILDKHPTVNEDIPDKILTGRVIIKRNVKEFLEQDVVFEDEDAPTKVDVVIFATGYQMKFPFLEDKYFRNDSGGIEMYKHIFPLKSSSQKTLALIGFTSPIGPLAPVAEMQCRVAALSFSGRITLPSKESLLADTALSSQRPLLTSKNTAECHAMDYVEYMDELAELIGAKPDIAGRFMKDPELYWNCFNGPCLPYQYRLAGHHSWDGARQAILGYKQRTKAAFSSKKACSESYAMKSALMKPSCLIAAAVAFAVCMLVSL